MPDTPPPQSIDDWLRHRLDALDRRLDVRLAEIRARQDEEIMLLKALSCQLRSRVERVERRAARTAGG